MTKANAPLTAIEERTGVPAVTVMTVIDALRTLPVDERMEAMGMQRVFPIEWDDWCPRTYQEKRADA